jgi:hypothetical protein
MKTTRWFLLTVSCLCAFLTLLLILSNSAPVQTAARPVEAAPLAPLTCTTHTTGMTLTLSPLKPRVGDTFVATATLANEGCGLVGLPLYRLMVESEPAEMLVPQSPTSAPHTLGLGPGNSDVMTFTLKAVNAGLARINVSASFEVHVDGGAYWSTDATGPSIVTVPFTESLVLQQAAEAVGCTEFVLVEGGDHYRSNCVVAAGHSLDAHIERFADAAAAQTEFSARQGTLILEPFHCYPAYSWAQTLIMPLRESGHSWLADRWIITTHTVDDTPLYPSPLRVSEAVYSAAIRQNLLRACDVSYLPTIQK